MSSMTGAEISASSASPPARRWPTLLMIGFAFLFVLVPFLFWHGTWFGRRLTDDELARYLADFKRLRKPQHALVQISERMVHGDPTVRRWYPQVEALASHSLPELRAMAAWVMGQDNKEAGFLPVLLRLLEDFNPMVRRNAALSLVRFGDGSGRPELVAMLRPYVVRAPQGGRIKFRLKTGDPTNPGTLLARSQPSSGETAEIRSPLPGYVESKHVDDGSTVEAGQEILTLAPAAEQVWEALRALYLVGQAEDLPDVERFARGLPRMPEQIQRQARLTAEAIRNRAAQRGSRN